MYLLYTRLQNDLGETELQLMTEVLKSAEAWILFALALLLVPLNWGLESKKWQLITGLVEPISFKTASLSVYSGICAGNFAPGRATEFLGKLLYFSDANKTRVALLHFLNGMVQLSLTLIIGLAALVTKVDQWPPHLTAYAMPMIYFSILLLVLFIALACRSESLIQKISKWFSSKFPVHLTPLTIPPVLWMKLFSLSAIRYMVFGTQFWLLLNLYPGERMAGQLAEGIALYFMITSLLPMVSFLEAPIRAAIALVVLSQNGLSPAQLTLSTLLLWFLNIVLPSLVGYLALLRMQFDFKLLFPSKVRQ